MINQEEEIWKPIWGSRNYFVSNYGRVKRAGSYRWNTYNKKWSYYPEHIMSQSDNNSKGYYRVPICFKDGTSRQIAVHRLVAEAFKVNPDINKYTQVNHLDGNKANNYWRNLQWCTDEMNRKHAVEHSLFSHGKAQSDVCHLRKLDENQVRQIPEMLKTMSLTEVAKALGVGKTTISEIRAGRSWKHLNLDFS